MAILESRIDTGSEAYRENRERWAALLARPEATLLCFCNDPARCHRTVLARLLVKLGATYCGER